jgi:hypothetical protein
MAISSGAGPHFAWMTINGMTLPIEHGSVEMQATREASTFSVAIPYSYPGAIESLANISDPSVVISVTTRGVTAPLLTGEADLVTYDLIGRTIHINGRDKAGALHATKTSEKWLNKQGSDIVTDLAGRIGLSVQAEASGLMAGKKVKSDYARISDNVSFAYVIHKLAEFDGARWFVDGGGTLHYQSTANPSGVYTLNYGAPTTGPISADFTQLRIKHNIQAAKGVAVTVKSWNPKLKQAFTATSNVQSKLGLGSSPYNYHIPNLEQDHVDKHAKSAANERARHEYTIQASVVGDPTIASGMDLQINGTGYFDQSYQMDSIHHEFGMSGHTTHITARSAGSGRSAS